MSMSISGQNERWAQLNAYQPPPSSSSGQDSAWDPTTVAASSPGSAGNGPSTGGTSGGLSDGTSLALIAFGSLGNGQTTASQAAGQNTATPAGSTAATQDESSLESQILTDVQSLISALTGATNTPATSGAANTTAQKPLTTASVSPTEPPGASPPPGPPPWSNAIPGTGTNADTGNAGGAAPGYSDGIRQQFALSAYSANTQAGVDSSATSSLTNISV